MHDGFRSNNSGSGLRSLTSYTPVGLAGSAIVWAHNTTGLPWWGTLVLATLAIRTAMLPLFVLQILNRTRYASPEVQGHVALAIQLYRNDIRRGAPKRETAFTFIRTLGQIFSFANCHPAKSYMVLLAQLPVLVTYAMAVRQLGEQPGFDTGGLLWFTNLAIPDATLMLPIINAAILALNVMLSFASSNIEQRPFWQAFRDLLIATCLGSVILTSFAPQGFFLYSIPSVLISMLMSHITKLKQLQPLLQRLAWHGRPRVEPPPQVFMAAAGQKPWPARPVRAH